MHNALDLSTIQLFRSSFLQTETGVEKILTMRWKILKRLHILYSENELYVKDNQAVLMPTMKWNWIVQSFAMKLLKSVWAVWKDGKTFSFYFIFWVFDKFFNHFF